MKSFFDVGRITDAHGIKGEVKIFPITDDLNNLKNQTVFYINQTLYDIEWIKSTNDRMIVKFSQINDRSHALELKGQFISIPRENAAPLSNDAYYIEDIIGCDVYQNEQFLGKVYDVIITGANDVYCISDQKREILIPVIKQVIKNIDMNNRRIDVVLLKGLIDNENL